MRIPTPEEARTALTPDQIAHYESIGQRLQRSHGKTPAGFYLTGWLWKNLAEAERIGWSESFINESLDSAYISLLSDIKGLINSKPAYKERKMTETITSDIHRIKFNSRQEFAEFATRAEAPRYSVICSSFYREHHLVLGVVPGEALFSNNQTALNKVAIAWDRNQVKVSLVPTDRNPVYCVPSDWPDHTWLVTANEDFPDDLIEPVFSIDGPLLSASQEKAEEIALEQLCNQDEHPLLFIDKQDDIDKEFLSEILADDAEKSSWEFNEQSV